MRRFEGGNLRELKYHRNTLSMRISRKALVIVTPSIDKCNTNQPPHRRSAMAGECSINGNSLELVPSTNDKGREQ